VEVKFSINMDMITGNTIVRVDGYRNHEAFLFPETVDNDDVCNCCMIWDKDKVNNLENVKTLMDILEHGTNACLSHLERKI